ncbi:hypothetical protein [Comamonas testosteroni]|uniref:hypothetical protein n=1 Tax=Comamonas testosteroni TaxID=285 RepID=UPI00068144BF|nr:hypothetical protein [Comamonas testosteroni]
MKRVIFGMVAGVVSMTALADAPFTADEKKVRAALEERLKDAESARVRRLHVSKVDGTLHLCGEVNAKNSYGAYVGYEKFYGMIFPRPNGKDLYHILGVGDASAEMCRTLGM